MMLTSSSVIRTTRRFHPGFLILPLLLSCRTIPLEERLPIRVPARLDMAAVELAVVVGVVNPGIALNFQHTAAQITHEILTAVFGPGRPNRSWFVESREPGVVFAGCQKRSELSRGRGPVRHESGHDRYRS